MSEHSVSSKRRCHCGEIARSLTSKTLSNPGRRFYKCAKPEINSCGFWEWRDEELSDRAMAVISSIKSELEVANVKIVNLKGLLDNVTAERDLLKERLNKEVEKTRGLEEFLLKMKMFIIVLCAIFLGYAASLIM